jgi:hypothetical protein
MTPEQIQQTAADKTARIALEIRNFIHDTPGLTAKEVGKRCDMDNVGQLLKRPGITLVVVLRILEAVREICGEQGLSVRPLQHKIVDLITAKP